MDATSGRLMAVKQVERPSDSQVPFSRKSVMFRALMQEIGLLRTLRHENIVRYLCKCPLLFC